MGDILHNIWNIWKMFGKLLKYFEYFKKKMNTFKIFEMIQNILNIFKIFDATKHAAVKANLHKANHGVLHIIPWKNCLIKDIR